MNYDEYKLAGLLDNNKNKNNNDNSNNNQIPPQESPEIFSEQKKEEEVEGGAKETTERIDESVSFEPELSLLATKSDNYNYACKAEAGNSLQAATVAAAAAAAASEAKAGVVDSSFVVSSSTGTKQQVIENNSDKDTNNDNLSGNNSRDSNKSKNIISGSNNDDDAIEKGGPFDRPEKMIMTIRGVDRQQKQQQVMDEQKVGVGVVGEQTFGTARETTMTSKPGVGVGVANADEEEEDSETDTKSVGQLVLNVDFAPPKLEQLEGQHQFQQHKPQLCPSSLGGTGSETAIESLTKDYSTHFCQLNSSQCTTATTATTTSHSIEVSLCIKQQRPLEEEDETTNFQVANDKEAPLKDKRRDVDEDGNASPQQQRQQTNSNLPKESVLVKKDELRADDEILPSCDKDFQRRLETRLFAECSGKNQISGNNYDSSSSTRKRVATRRRISLRRGDSSSSGENFPAQELNERGEEEVSKSIPSSSQQQQPNQQARVTTNSSKRRLVYERIDKFSLEIGHIISPSSNNNNSTSITTRSGRPILPFKNGTFDACFCFNLLNLRVSSASSAANNNNQDCACLKVSNSSTVQAATPAADQAEESKRWLRMERLTTELRLEMLNELSRVVKSKGKIMVTVFAYECQQQHQWQQEASDECKQQQQQQHSEQEGCVKKTDISLRSSELQTASLVSKQRQQTDLDAKLKIDIRKGEPFSGGKQFDVLETQTEKSNDENTNNSSNKENKNDGQLEVEDSCCPQCRLDFVRSKLKRRNLTGSRDNLDSRFGVIRRKFGREDKENNNEESEDGEDGEGDDFDDRGDICKRNKNKNENEFEFKNENEVALKESDKLQEEVRESIRVARNSAKQANTNNNNNSVNFSANVNLRKNNQASPSSASTFCRVLAEGNLFMNTIKAQQPQQQQRDDDEVKNKRRKNYGNENDYYDDTATCDTIQQLIERAQQRDQQQQYKQPHQMSPFDVTPFQLRRPKLNHSMTTMTSDSNGGESKGVAINTNTTAPQITTQISGLSRRYSSVIWRAVGKGGGGGSGEGGALFYGGRADSINQQDDSLANNIQHFQRHRDSISEAAKRIGRRLSLGGATILNRIFANPSGSGSGENNSLDENENDENNNSGEEDNNVVDLKLGEQQEKTTTTSQSFCDIKVSEGQLCEPGNSSDALEANGHDKRKQVAAQYQNQNPQQQQMYLMTDVMKLFQDGEFAKRHRQSIAVQTFFTKSIEVNADEEEELERRGVLNTNQQDQHHQKQSHHQQLNMAERLHEEEAAVMESEEEQEEGQKRGNFCERFRKEEDNLGGDEDLCGAEEFDVGGEDDFELEESTSSGWTAPTSTTNPDSTSNSAGNNNNNQSNAINSQEKEPYSSNNAASTTYKPATTTNNNSAGKVVADYLMSSRTRSRRRCNSSNVASRSVDQTSDKSGGSGSRFVGIKQLDQQQQQQLLNRDLSSTRFRYDYNRNSLPITSAPTGAAVSSTNLADINSTVALSEHELLRYAKDNNQNQELMQSSHNNQVSVENSNNTSNNITDRTNTDGLEAYKSSSTVTTTTTSSSTRDHDLDLVRRTTSSSRYMTTTTNTSSSNDGDHQQQTQERLRGDRSFLPKATMLSESMPANINSIVDSAAAAATATNAAAALQTTSNHPTKEAFDRINSDFSSFTLITTTTSSTKTNNTSSSSNNNNENENEIENNNNNVSGNNSDAQQQQQQQGENARSLSKQVVDGIKTTSKNNEFRPTNTTTTTAHKTHLHNQQQRLSKQIQQQQQQQQLQQQQQRRAFSETEAYSSSGSGSFAANNMQQATSIDINHHISMRSIGGGGGGAGNVAGKDHHFNFDHQYNANNHNKALVASNLASIGCCNNSSELDHHNQHQHHYRHHHQVASAAKMLPSSSGLPQKSSTVTATTSATTNRAQRAASGGAQSQTIKKGSNFGSATNSNGAVAAMNRYKASIGAIDYQAIKGAATSTSGSAGSSSTTSANHHSMSNLIGSSRRTSGGASQLAYTPLNDQTNNSNQAAAAAAAAAGGSCAYQQQFDMYAKSSQPAGTAAGISSTGAGNSKYQKQQWCHSNTFSSSLNSDISTTTSGPKDTTEKDSSRRTSTLSGISSIYQQETSLGLATPYSYGAGTSTPANSQAAACSNMGSIPELATFGLNQQQQQQQQQGSQFNNQGGVNMPASELDGFGNNPMKFKHWEVLSQIPSTGAGSSNIAAASAANAVSMSAAAATIATATAMTAAKQGKMPFEDAQEQQNSGNNQSTSSEVVMESSDESLHNQRAELIKQGQQRELKQQPQTIQQERQKQGGANLNETTPTWNSDFESTSINLQRVAQSLRSQLRERLSTMKSLNSFIGLNVSMGNFDNQNLIQEEPLSSGQPGSGTEGTQCEGQQQQQQQHSTFGSQLKVGPSVNDLYQMQRQNSVTSPSASANTLSRTSKTETPTPATLKSFFRSTSSAAFNAFASSFQHQSSSTSTPTATTVIPGGANLSTSSQHFGSLSSDVFDPPTNNGGGTNTHNGNNNNNNLGASSPLESIGKFGTGLLGGEQQQQQLNDSAAGSSSIRSPLSPISVTSTRFFARIRDKFSLGPSVNASGTSGGGPNSTPSPRPNSALSTSTSTSLNPTVVNLNSQQFSAAVGGSSSNKTLAEKQGYEPTTQFESNVEIIAGNERKSPKDKEQQREQQQQQRSLEFNDATKLNTLDEHVCIETGWKGGGEKKAGSAIIDEKESNNATTTTTTSNTKSTSATSTSASKITDPFTGTSRALNQGGLTENKEKGEEVSLFVAPIKQISSTIQADSNNNNNNNNNSNADDNDDTDNASSSNDNKDNINNNNVKLAAQSQSKPPLGAKTYQQLGDSYEDYEHVVSSRRPSFQRQLDEQVNQVYRMAVNRKFQSSLLAATAAADGVSSIGSVGEQGNNNAINNIRQLNDINGNARPEFLPRNALSGGSDLDSIIRPMSSILSSSGMPISGSVGGGQYPVSTANYAHPASIYLQNESAGYFPGQSQQQQQQMRFTGSNQGNNQGDDGMRWFESSQQSIESSSSARSLRSCWFSMPELYAMNYNDSSSQSPSGILYQPNPTNLMGASPVMEELLSALSSELPGADHQHRQQQQRQQQQQQRLQQQQQSSLDWPSNQLYKQVASDQGQNWSLSDLNLTSDDIAPNAPIGLGLDKEPCCSKLMTAAATQNLGAATLPGKPHETIELTKQAMELIKCSTLDDSICASMKSSTSSKEAVALSGNQAMVASANCGINEQVSDKASCVKQHSAAAAGGGGDDGVGANEYQNTSRPTSQNSTISNTSCALSDLNSSDLQDARSPISQHHWTGTESVSPMTPLNVSPLSTTNGQQQQQPQQASSEAQQQHQQSDEVEAGAGTQIVSVPQCTVVNIDKADSKQTDNLQAESRSTTTTGQLLLLEETTTEQKEASPKAALLTASNATTTITTTTTTTTTTMTPNSIQVPTNKPRAMSMIQLEQPNANQIEAGDTPSPVSGRSSTNFLGLENSPASKYIPRRRSTRGCLLPSIDVAPAATTLDLRLASRKNRVRLTDLHPITFINDKEFLNSMNSIKKANDNKLNAIFNSPVGRRLSVNAEMAQHSPFNQAKSGIKIGLTGYVYLDTRKSDLFQQHQQHYNQQQQQNFRRPSLAPNFWLNRKRSDCGVGLAPGGGGGGGGRENGGDFQSINGSSASNDMNHYNNQTYLAPDGSIRSRPRAASCLPNALNTITIHPTQVLNNNNNSSSNDKSVMSDHCVNTKNTEHNIEIRDSHSPSSLSTKTQIQSDKVELEGAVAIGAERQQQQQQTDNSDKNCFKREHEHTSQVAGLSSAANFSGKFSQFNLNKPIPTPPSGYHFDKRRSTLALLERLSESSIEFDPDNAANRNDQPTTDSSLTKNRQFDSSTGERQQRQLLVDHPARKEHRKSFSCLMKVEENNELNKPQQQQQQFKGHKKKDQTQAREHSTTTDSSPTSSSSSSHSFEDENHQRQVDHLRHLNQRQDSSSSDDGDLDKLIAQYPNVGFPVSSNLAASQSSEQTIGKSLAALTNRGGNLRQRRCPPGEFMHARSIGSHQSSQQQYHYQSSPSSSSSDRVVKNDMILKQLLLAANAASLTSAAAQNVANQAKPAFDGPSLKEMRRYSAINLYQQSDDVFVANSMKRPPLSQAHMLNALPLLAGTLPVLTPTNNSHKQHPQLQQQPLTQTQQHQQQPQPLQQQQQTKPPMYNQLPVLTTGPHSGLKSIITGNSGLNAPKNVSQTETNRNITNNTQVTTRAGSAINAALVAEVDIEEQLNRLRHQERRSMGFGSVMGGFLNNNNNSNDRPINERTMSLSSAGSGGSCWLVGDDVVGLSSECGELGGDLNILPNKSADIAASILQETETATSMETNSTSCKDGSDDNNRPPPSPPTLIMEHHQPNVGVIHANKPASPPTGVKSPPQSPNLTTITQTTLTTAIVSGGLTNTTTSQPPSTLLIGGSSRTTADQIYSSGSKSCEPFKQLDTIIEGRGLLLGAEQQADPTYAHRLRKLSVSNPRRSSLNNGQAAAADSDDWCRCDLVPTRRLSSARKINKKQELRSSISSSTKRKSEGVHHQTDTVAIQASSAASASSISSSSKFVLDTMRSLARRTLNNFTTISGSPTPTIQTTTAAATTTTTTSMTTTNSEIVNQKRKNQESVLSSQIPLAVATSQSSKLILCTDKKENKGRQQRSSSMIVGGSVGSSGGGGGSSFMSTWSSQPSTSQPTLPSRLLREKVRAGKDQVTAMKLMQQKQRQQAGNSGKKIKSNTSETLQLDELEADELDEASISSNSSSSTSTATTPTSHSTTTSTVTGSADDSSLMSLDDAENYRAKNKGNKMNCGRSLERTSSSSSVTSSASMVSANLADLGEKVPSSKDELDDRERLSKVTPKMEESVGLSNKVDQRLAADKKSELEAVKGGPTKARREEEEDVEVEEVGEEEEEEEVDEDEEIDDEDEDEEIEQPKVCYKCNKKILMEEEYLTNDDEEEEEADEDEDDGFVDVKDGDAADLELSNHDKLVSRGDNNSISISSTTNQQPLSSSMQSDAKDNSYKKGIESSGHSSGHASLANSKSLGAGASSKSRRPSQSVGKAHHSRHSRGAARRSASMNSAEQSSSGGACDQVGGANQIAGASASSSGGTNQSGPHLNRRKNKWHIQRNLAPKLKRQRSFSANYAPEVPNPVMPPPRRFSAAPTLSCPHRNKSSSHSSSSLHHTYSIDSSESIITVIPANRGQDLKRTSRGSLSCNSSSGVGGVSGGNQMDGSFGPAGSLYALPRSPLSPRSPSRCSPGLLTPNTPNTSEPPTSIELPFSPLTCSSTGQITMIQPPPQPTTQQQTSGTSNRIVVQTSLSDGTSADLRSTSSFNLALPREKSVSNSLCVLSGEEDNLSLAVENGTSYNSSRNELENFENDLDGTQTDAELDYEPQIEEDEDPAGGGDRVTTSSDQFVSNAYHQQSVNVGVGVDVSLRCNNTQIVDPNSPVICETINDFCARHTREELESLVNQVGYLTISDCYFSERSSTLCMVIEVKEK